MFKLEKQQIDALKFQALQQFLEQAVQHLRQELSDQTRQYTDAQLRNRVRICIQRTQKYELKSKREVMCFVDVTFLLGESFDTDGSQPWAMALLSSTRLSSGDRANLLLATACSVYRDTLAPR